jgi:hypothetical protein
MLELGRIITLRLYYCRSSKPNPNLPKSGQAPASLRRAKGNQRKSLGFSWISFAELGLFNGLQRPPRPKNSLSAPSFPLAFQSPGGASISDWARVPRILVFAKKIRQNETRERFFLIPAELGRRRRIGEAAAAGKDAIELHPPAVGQSCVAFFRPKPVSSRPRRRRSIPCSCGGLRKRGHRCPERRTSIPRFR